MRHNGQHSGGVKNYKNNLMKRLLPLGANHEFVLLYQNPDLIGQYAEHANVREIAYLSWLTGHLSENGLEGSPIWQVLQRELKVYEALKLAPYLRKVRRMFWKLINRLTRR
jgi:hypothetical protein